MIVSSGNTAVTMGKARGGEKVYFVYIVSCAHFMSPIKEL
jgi:hypothetical protein